MSEAHGVMSDNLGGATLVYSNEQRTFFRYTPPEIEVSVTGTALRRVYGLARRLRLVAPAGWLVLQPERLVLDPSRTLVWRVRPLGEPPSCLVNLRLLIERDDGGETEIVHAVPVEVRGRSQFDPRRHAFPVANRADEFGEVEPDPSIFYQTYRHAPLGRIFYEGLYRDVVFLTGQGERKGGLCTGIARTALEFSLRCPDGDIREEDPEALRRAAMIWHGRQLADRALLASTLAWGTRGSSDAYAAFRQRVLASGTSDVAMDVNVPRPWRRDLFKALIGSGHTVVPYAFRQRSDDRAEVWVYDPNHPRPAEMRDSVITFDLANNTYRYRHFDGRQAGRPSKVLAVAQSQYRQADSGILGGIASLALYGQRWLPEQRLPAPLVALGMLGLGLVFILSRLGLALRGMAHLNSPRQS